MRPAKARTGRSSPARRKPRQQMLHTAPRLEDIDISALGLPAGQTVLLYWPAAALSPNARPTLRQKMHARQAYRRSCWALTLQSKLQAPDGDGPIAIALTMFPPTS